jgi:GxxExxY protein
MESQRREDAKLSVLDPTIELVAKQVVDSVFHVHKYYGPGMLESIYEMALFRTLQKRSLNPVRQSVVPVYFEGELMDGSFRADIIVDNSILLEIKACESLLPVHRAQTLSYMRLCNLKLGFLINFNVPIIKNGIVRIIDERFASSRLSDSLQKSVV